MAPSWALSSQNADDIGRNSDQYIQTRARYHAGHMQEASELVAWISEQPDAKYKLVYIIINKALKLMAIRRVLISQDGKEAYMAFAKYEQTWVRYIRNGRRHHTGYMTMKRYGPFCIDEATQMAMFARIVHAITLSP